MDVVERLWRALFSKEAVTPRDYADERSLMMQFFQWDSLGKPDTSWWKYFEEQLPVLSSYGVTHVWLPPPNKGMDQFGRGYDAYDLWDLGEFHQKGTISTRWGTKPELQNSCEKAADMGICILVDAVLNHKMGADELDTCPAVPVDAQNRLKSIGPKRIIDGWLKFHFPGREGKYSDFCWSSQHFSGIDYDDRTKSVDVFRLSGKNHKGWSKHVASELGNYDYLMGCNINYQHKEVQDDIMKWGCWVLHTLQAGGFRLDAIKHIDHKFLYRFLKHVRARNGGRLFVVGEYWSSRLDLIQQTLKNFRHSIRLFDVPLHYNFHNASREGSRYDLRCILDQSLVKTNPQCAVTFVDNHDTQPGQMLESWVEEWFKPLAYALILLRPYGVPCLFYGDIFPDQPLHNNTVADKVNALIRLRQSHALGPIEDFTSDDPNVIGFVRKGVSKTTGCAVLLSNSEPSGNRPALRMRIGKENAGSGLRLIIGEGNPVKVQEDGWAIFEMRGPGLAVWIPP